MNEEFHKTVAGYSKVCLTRLLSLIGKMALTRFKFTLREKWIKNGKQDPAL